MCRQRPPLTRECLSWIASELRPKKTALAGCGSKALLFAPPLSEHLRYRNFASRTRAGMGAGRPGLGAAGHGGLRGV